MNAVADESVHAIAVVRTMDFVMMLAFIWCRTESRHERKGRARCRPMLGNSTLKVTIYDYVCKYLHCWR